MVEIEADCLPGSGRGVVGFVFLAEAQGVVGEEAMEYRDRRLEAVLR